MSSNLSLYIHSQANNMADTKIFEVAFEKNKLNDSEFMRLKKGKLWICLLNKALGVLPDIKDDFNETVLSKTPVHFFDSGCVQKPRHGWFQKVNSQNEHIPRKIGRTHTSDS